MNGCGRIPTKLYLQNHVVGQIWPTGSITCQPLTALDDTQEVTWRRGSSLLLCKMGTSRVRQFYMGQKRALNVGVPDQVVGAEART